MIAKDEESTVGRTLRSLAHQSIFDEFLVHILVYANGCSDRTAECASKAISKYLVDKITDFNVVDSLESGKSRSWNKAVHELTPLGTSIILFLDADIVIADPRVCEDMINLLCADKQAEACSGRPTKSFAIKKRPNWGERLSLWVSEAGRADRSINGSLYCLKAQAALTIWLPDETPVEDGFLNAMVRTRGFSRPDDASLVTQVDRTTHYYDPPNFLGVLSHERRVIVGTMINRWLFEHLWALKVTSTVGPMIRDLNRDNPPWVNRIVETRTRRKIWVIPKSVMLGRFPSLANSSLAKLALKIPFGVCVTVLNLIVCFLANRVLHRSGAAKSW